MYEGTDGKKRMGVDAVGLTEELLAGVGGGCLVLLGTWRAWWRVNALRWVSDKF